MPARLLLVDDTAINLDLLEARLSPLGYSLTKAGGGREALAAFARDRPDLILLDVRMPDLDGIEVLTRIRADARGPRVPVILITAQTEREDRLHGFEAGADEFLEKPIDHELLVARVRTLLRLKEACDELARRNAALERLQRAQRELASFIVHDLKNPLAIVHMNIGWVKANVGVVKGRDLDEALTDSLDATTRLQRMLEDLLAVARLEQADAPLQRASVDLDELLNKMRRAHTCEAREGQVALCVDAGTGLRVNMDRAIVERVLENLLRNALRYTPKKGRIGLSTRVGADIEVAVSNTGLPIPPLQRTRIFEKFRRGGDAPMLDGHAGLGLYFCTRAMEAHGGSIAVVETSEWATSFVLRFPKVDRPTA